MNSASVVSKAARTGQISSYNGQTQTGQTGQTGQNLEGGIKHDMSQLIVPVMDASGRPLLIVQAERLQALMGIDVEIAQALCKFFGMAVDHASVSSVCDTYVCI
jgi:hypothetical protein